VEEKSTKSHQERTIALGHAGVVLLRLHRSECVDRAQVGEVELGPDNYVFSDRIEGTTPVRPDAVTGFFRRVSNDLALPEVHLHSLRHFMATQLASRGDVSARTLAGRLGHADASVSLKVYSAFFPPADVEAAEYVGSHPAARSSRCRLALVPPYPDPPAGEALATTVTAGKLSVRVSERGYLDSSQTTDAYCLVEGQTTIMMLKPEGSRVQKGEIVCQLDSASLRDQLVNQRITVKSAEANFENAKLARQVAELAVVEYVEGIFPAELTALKDAVAAAESTIEKANTRLERTRIARKQIQETLAKKASEKSPADIVAELDIEDRLESAELTVAHQKMAADEAKAKQKILEQITKGRMLRDLKSEVEKKHSDELAKKATWELETNKERKLERQIAVCDIKAPADGTIVYANNPNRLGVLPLIEEGATVRLRQKILSVIDLDRPLRVNAQVHESQVHKLAQGMQAKVKVDAFPDESFSGTVLEVAPLPFASSSHSANLYLTRVRLDRRLDGLRPGMTAEVEIHVTERDNVLSVPVESVVRYENKDHVAVKKPDGTIDWREVTLGLSNEKVVEVKQGLRSGEQVATKPLDLLSEQQKRAIRNAPTPPAGRRTSRPAPAGKRSRSQ